MNEPRAHLAPLKPLGALRLIAENADGRSPVARCRVCGMWGEEWTTADGATRARRTGRPGTVLACSCDRATWEEVTPQEIAQAVLDAPRPPTPAARLGRFLRESIAETDGVEAAEQVGEMDLAKALLARFPGLEALL